MENLYLNKIGQNSRYSMHALEGMLNEMENSWDLGDYYISEVYILFKGLQKQFADIQGLCEEAEKEMATKKSHKAFPVEAFLYTETIE